MYLLSLFFINCTEYRSSKQPVLVTHIFMHTMTKPRFLVLWHWCIDVKWVFLSANVPRTVCTYIYLIQIRTLNFSFYLSHILVTVAVVGVVVVVSGFYLVYLCHLIVWYVVASVPWSQNYIHFFLIFNAFIFVIIHKIDHFQFSAFCCWFFFFLFLSLFL